MFKKKCFSCNKKVEKKFNFCPYCGASFKKKNEEENYGMLGRDDFIPDMQRQAQPKIPLGLNKIMGHLVKQLNKELNNLGNESLQASPKGFSIQISTGKPQIKEVQGRPIKEIMNNISEEEIGRRTKLPRAEAESSIRRLADRIIYEVKTPGIKNKEQVIITKLENSIEIKAYSKDKCYYKTIPLKFEIQKWYLLNEKIILELKG